MRITLLFVQPCFTTLHHNPTVSRGGFGENDSVSLFLEQGPVSQRVVINRKFS